MIKATCVGFIGYLPEFPFNVTKISHFIKMFWAKSAKWKMFVQSLNWFQGETFVYQDGKRHFLAPRCNYRKPTRDRTTNRGFILLSAWLWTWCHVPPFGQGKNNHRCWTRRALLRAKPPSLSHAFQSEPNKSPKAAAAARPAQGLPAANPKEN